MTALLIALLFLGAGMAFFLQHRSQVTLDRENQSLRQRIEELSQLVSENGRFSRPVAQATPSGSLSNGLFLELLRLRGEVGRLRVESREAEKLRNENQRLRTDTASGKRLAETASPGATTQGDVPKESWTFAGYATPEATVHSAVWAINSGDVKTFYASLTEECRQKVASEEKGQPATDMAAKGIHLFSKFTAFRIDGRDDPSDSTVILTVSMIRPDGTPETEKMTMKRVGAEWKLAPD